MTQAGDRELVAIDPRTGRPLGTYDESTPTQVEAAVADATVAFTVLRSSSGAQRASLLRASATSLEALGDELLEVADAETALGHERLIGERARTCNQLRAFADMVDEGSFVEAILDPADPDATPPRPDLRRMLVPIGPVAVFGAGNFPLAFGVPGGDTAAAWAAGCPVVFKGHPGHPATSELCARALADAITEAGLPSGIFTLLQGAGEDVGHAVTIAEGIRALAFTGSLRGGRALFDLAASRRVPIPVYAEMGSVNPVFVTPAAAAARSDQIGEAFVASVTLAAGQMCTKPGLLVVPDDGADAIIAAARRALATWSGGVLLTERTRGLLDERLDVTLRHPGIEVVARSEATTAPGGCDARAVLLAADAQALLAAPSLVEEHFGPVSIIVRCASPEEMLAVAGSIEGSLAAAIHTDDGDESVVSALTDHLHERVGRLVFDGFPTGVSVSAAMQHGGPYPATTSPLHTSVGTTAVRRFLRPIAWQDAPQHVLPEALRDGNPLRLRRRVGGHDGIDGGAPSPPTG